MTLWADAVLQWPLGVSVTAAVALSAALFLVSVRLTRRVWPHPVLKENNELAASPTRCTG
jgi:hypothetical protein